MLNSLEDLVFMIARCIDDSFYIRSTNRYFIRSKREYFWGLEIWYFRHCPTSIAHYLSWWLDLGIKAISNLLYLLGVLLTPPPNDLQTCTINLPNMEGVVSKTTNYLPEVMMNERITLIINIIEGTCVTFFWPTVKMITTWDLIKKIIKLIGVSFIYICKCTWSTTFRIWVV